MNNQEWRRIILKDGTATHFSMNRDKQVRNDNTGQLRKPCTTSSNKNAPLNQVCLYCDNKTHTIHIHKTYTKLFGRDPDFDKNHRKLIYDRKVINGYWITKDGKVFSENKQNYLIPQTISEDWLGYGIKLNDGKQRMLYTHRLVMETYGRSKPRKGMQIKHIDLNRQNNHIDNLEWVTLFNNKRHSWTVRKNKRPEYEVELFNLFYKTSIYKSVIVNDNGVETEYESIWDIVPEIGISYAGINNRIRKGITLNGIHIRWGEMKTELSRFKRIWIKILTQHFINPNSKTKKLILGQTKCAYRHLVLFDMLLEVNSIEDVKNYIDNNPVILVKNLKDSSC